MQQMAEVRFVWKQGERRVGCDLHAFAARRALAQHRVVCAPRMAARPVGLARPANPTSGWASRRRDDATMRQCSSLRGALSRFGEAKPFEPSQAKHEQSEPKTSKAEPKASAASFVSPRLLCAGRCGFAFSATDSLVRRRRSGRTGSSDREGQREADFRRRLTLKFRRVGSLGLVVHEDKTSSRRTFGTSALPVDSSARPAKPKLPKGLQEDACQEKATAGLRRLPPRRDTAPPACLSLETWKQGIVKRAPPKLHPHPPRRSTLARPHRLTLRHKAQPRRVVFKPHLANLCVLAAQSVLLLLDLTASLSSSQRRAVESCPHLIPSALTLSILFSTLRSVSLSLHLLHRDQPFCLQIDTADGAARIDISARAA
ncbi:hypothetical protein L1887_59621 [Cichorium endivia]|nr:hypothetical protein L1887_59621 [Cichorium endivia]